MQSLLTWLFFSSQYPRAARVLGRVVLLACAGGLGVVAYLIWLLQQNPRALDGKLPF